MSFTKSGNAIDKNILLIPFMLNIIPLNHIGIYIAFFYVKFYFHQNPHIKTVGMRKFFLFIEGKSRNEGFSFLRTLYSTSLIHLHCSLPIIPFQLQRFIFYKCLSSANPDEQSLLLQKSNCCEVSLKYLPFSQFFSVLIREIGT